jgi:hypothetical protein
MIVAEIEDLEISNLVRVINAGHRAGRSQNHILDRIYQYRFFRVEIGGYGVP